MNALTNWLNGSFTWGGYLIMRGLSIVLVLILVLILYGIWMISWYQPNWWTGLKNFVKKLFTKK